MIQIFEYGNSPIQFEIVDGQVMANATLMAKAFERKPDDIFKTKSWIEFENVVIEDLNCRFEDIRSVKNGGVDFGSWIHEELVIEFARRLNPKFSLWCNRKIGELLRTGSVSIKPKELSRKELALMVVETEEALEKEIEKSKQLEAKTLKLQPKADYLDLIIDNDDMVDIGQSAKILDLGFGRNKLFEKLREKGVLFKNKNEPIQKYIDKGYFKLKEMVIERNSHSPFIVIKVLVTQKGLKFISDLFNATGSAGQLARVS